MIISFARQKETKFMIPLKIKMIWMILLRIKKIKIMTVKIQTGKVLMLMTIQTNQMVVEAQMKMIMVIK